MSKIFLNFRHVAHNFPLKLQNSKVHNFLDIMPIFLKLLNFTNFNMVFPVVVLIFDFGFWFWSFQKECSMAISFCVFSFFSWFNDKKVIDFISDICRSLSIPRPLYPYHVNHIVQEQQFYYKQTMDLTFFNILDFRAWLAELVKLSRL
jgi:hypothetical protein